MAYVTAPPREAHSHLLTMNFTSGFSLRIPLVGIGCPQFIRSICVCVHIYDKVSGGVHITFLHLYSVGKEKNCLFILSPFHPLRQFWVK